MFDYVRNNSRVLFFVMLLLIIPSFVFFGVQGYSRFREGTTAVATVAGQSITAAELDAAHRNQIERLRAQSPGVDVKLLDTPEMKRQTLESLVRERVMRTAADKLHLVTSDERLQRLFLNDPQFAFLRNPDGSVNKDILSAQGMSSDAFAERLRSDLSVRQVLEGVAGSAVASKSVADAALDAFLQQREIQVAKFDAKDYLSKVNPSDADIEAYYKNPAHAAQFQSPEQASIEYLVLDLESIKKGITVSEEDLRKYYEENAARYGVPEERRASHILVKADKSAPTAERDKAKAKAQQLLAQVKQNPASFADVAKKNSDDPGSAANGGDLDFFSRGAMVKSFEDAAFAMKQGEISDVIETDFGYHIITVTGKRGGEKKPFEAVKAEIEDEVRKQLAQARYSEAAEQFSNLVYEQSDTLQPAADKLKLTIQKAVNISRAPAPAAQGPLANPKFLDALFAAESVRTKRNTEAIEVGANQLVAGRVLEYSPARTLPLADVKSRVRQRVIDEQASALARKDGAEKLAAWQKAPDAASTALGAPIKVSRVQPSQQSREVIDAVLKAKADALPAWVGVDLGRQGYAVVRIAKLDGRAQVPDATQLPAQYARAFGAAETQAYYEALKSRLKAEITYDPQQSGK